MNKIDVTVTGAPNSGKSVIRQIIVDALSENGFDNIMVHYCDPFLGDEEILRQQRQNKQKRIESVRNYIEEINIYETQTHREQD
jgi:tRNA uridine 5-carbamoylmethylation protein Kti12